jgi:hypothetical protein
MLPQRQSNEEGQAHKLISNYKVLQEEKTLTDFI